MESDISPYLCEPGFCPRCGTVLPPLSVGVSCYNCKAKYGVEVYKRMKYHYVLHFNSRNNRSVAHQNKKDETEGPVVQRTCQECGNDKMTYYTLQLRSADEGQTVFYTCTKCKFKCSENS